jgi:predicted metalloprotease
MRGITATPESNRTARAGAGPVARAALLALLSTLLLLPTACDPGDIGPETARPGSPAPTAETVDSEVRTVRTLVERFWSAQFRAWGREYQPLGRFTSYQASDELTCGNEPIPAENAVYCPIGDFIAYDRDWLADYYRRIGDGPVYMIIPHEWGHAVQARLGQADRLSIQRELQADCYAGAFVQGAVRSGAVLPEPGDEQEIFLNLAEVADPTDAWWRPNAHGTVAQRTGAFRAGLAGGADTCRRLI